MGYHLILRKENNEIQHEYCEYYHELANFPIEDSSIIYQGEKHWKPFLVKDNDIYKGLSDLRFRGSMKAEQLFMKQALSQGYMLEVIDQNPLSFKQYYDVSSEFMKIKRGDFLIRNVRNIEIEVKCKTIYWENRKPYFYFEKEHLEKHLKMQEYTKTPVILAIYERLKDNENPNPEKLYMIDMDYIKKNIIEKNKLEPVYRDWGAAYKIPLNKCKKGFDLITFYKEK